MRLKNGYQMLKNFRREYSNMGIDIKKLPFSPFDQLKKWIDDAVSAGVTEPNAMIVSTVSESGTPSTRTVLLKGLDEDGLIFYTNYNSRKIKELQKNPNISTLFLWLDLERQVRVEGTYEKISTQQSDEYFATRPRLSQLGAWASPQSERVPDREVLDENFRRVEKKFLDREIPRPPHWGGIRIIPDYFEFWQGRTGRMHDRIVYELKEKERRIYRIAP